MKTPRRLREQPFHRLFPNLITMAGLCCGLSAIRFALSERWELSVGFILAAAIIDGMDGRIARLLGATSTFGAQLDSLSDFVCFGVAPVMVLYLWQMHEVKGIGWAIVLFFTICCAMRLARFNTALYADNIKAWQKQFFTGVPSPAGGILALLPLIMSFNTGPGLTVPVWVTIIYVAIIAILMASRIPTFAAKHVRIPHEWILAFMVTGALLVVLVIIEPWVMISVLSIFYLVSIPAGYRYYQYLKKQNA